MDGHRSRQLWGEARAWSGGGGQGKNAEWGSLGWFGSRALEGWRLAPVGLWLAIRVSIGHMDWHFALPALWSNKNFYLWYYPGLLRCTLDVLAVCSTWLEPQAYILPASQSCPWKPWAYSRWGYTIEGDQGVNPGQLEDQSWLFWSFHFYIFLVSW